MKYEFNVIMRSILFYVEKDNGFLRNMTKIYFVKNTFSGMCVCTVFGFV